MQLSRWEGNECLLKCSDVTGMMAVCLWKRPDHATIHDFQGTFICRLMLCQYATNKAQGSLGILRIDSMDRFTGGTCTNKVYAVKEAFGASKLTTRGFMQDFINSAQGRGGAGFHDRSMLWLIHHHVTDTKGWEKDVMEGMRII